MFALVSQLVPASRFPDQFLDWRTREVPWTLGADGVPKLNRGGKLLDQPVTVAQWGLQGWDLGDLPRARKAGDWLLSRQQSDGTWVYGFDTSFADGQTLHAPWRSALVQANAISLLVRLYHADGQTRWLDAARAALRPLQTAPLRSTLNGGLFFEEYPTSPPQHVMNGAMFVAVGLRDISPYDTSAARDYRELMSTFRANLHLWDTGNGAAYNLTDRHVDPNYVPVICPLMDSLNLRPMAGWGCGK